MSAHGKDPAPLHHEWSLADEWKASLPFHVVGLDLSLTSTGCAWINVVDGAHHVEVERWRPPSRGHLRLDYLMEQVGLAVAGATLVVLEGPSFGSVGAGSHDRAGLWWLVAHHLWTRRLDYAVVPPMSRAMYGAGRGNAAKDDVLAAVIRRYPDVPVAGNDQADALILAAMGVRHLGHPLERELPQVNLRAMDKIVWPDAEAAS